MGELAGADSLATDDQVTVDIDGHLIIAHSGKQDATPTLSIAPPCQSLTLLKSGSDGKSAQALPKHVTVVVNLVYKRRSARA